MFREEIAFLAPRNLSAVFIGRFGIDLGVLLKFPLVLALCKAVEREEWEVQDWALAPAPLSYYYA